MDRKEQYVGCATPLRRLADVATRVLRRDLPINSVSVRLAHIMSPMDHGKATRIRLAAKPYAGLDT